ncbi:putative Carbonyl reductase (NADPH) [Nitrospina gracilis 3/211]|uniref:Putative Carbonyl reductase (NADPH) n=1 Tax=Nitrospina gracilis (strain 3/211) TaxID=1266370 RepID=M1YWW0_NITG3|nr:MULTISPECIES: SDR family oxidoreductase [Nitrospina]MCF8722820.1 3-oxoacyl-[acyl-carrier protein] reductase [Nitrospina sp. Nb-3]CCQ89777.1 putative Carbonyl reductase (NADPH) [Nitrospina gracilis 3/211]
MTASTPGIVQEWDPKDWNRHRFGLAVDRWTFFRGKAFWVTGAGTGYGRCLAIVLAAAGAVVFLTGRRAEKLQESIEAARALGIDTAHCRAMPADLADADQIKLACERVHHAVPALTGLIHSAGLPARPEVSNPLRDESLEYWDRMQRINVTAPWLATRGIFPHMVKGGMVRVLMLTSEAGWAFTPGFGPYNLSKAAMNSLTGSLAAEFAAQYPDADIQINALVPGEAKTEMNTGSTLSPFTLVPMALVLLSCPAGGPNGKFFHRDGRHLAFAYAEPFPKPLL